MDLELGSYLLFRHDILHRFFCQINHSENELEQVEKVEHNKRIFLKNLQYHKNKNKAYVSIWKLCCDMLIHTDT